MNIKAGVSRRIIQGKVAPLHLIKLWHLHIAVASHFVLDITGGIIQRNKGVMLFPLKLWQKLNPPTAYSGQL